MKEINVFAPSLRGPVHIAHAHGEAMLDTNEGTLVIYSEDLQTSMKFNWDNVLNYTESPLKEEEHHV